MKTSITYHLPIILGESFIGREKIGPQCERVPRESDVVMVSWE